MPNIKPISDRLEIKAYNDVGSNGKKLNILHGLLINDRRAVFHFAV